MNTKKARLGPALLRAVDAGFLARQEHLVFGGTGAVGGAEVLQLVKLGEVIARQRPHARISIRILATGRTKQEIRRFTKRLFQVQHRDHQRTPSPLPGIGYRSVGGVEIELTTFSVEIPLPAGQINDVSTDLISADRWIDLLNRRPPRPFSSFVQNYIDAKQGRRRLRSVVVTIPLASLAAYKLTELEQLAEAHGISRSSAALEQIKTAFLRGLRDDLVLVREQFADEVIVAHTTAVGGMYDDEDNRRIVRLGFAHSAMDDRLRSKQLFAETLERLYAEAGIKVLVTAAAIGVDEISEQKVPLIHPQVRRQLESANNLGRHVIPAADIARGTIAIYDPVELELRDQVEGVISLSHRGPLVCDYILKSGENGYFTMSNAEALYRVMRVVSDSELGLLLARTALLGDDPAVPSFQDNVCYYTETDYARQVLDLLAQPELKANQLTGLQPKALQDLGSAKHQAELHTLGLFILLHRVETLDLRQLPNKRGLSTFSPKKYFEAHSQVLTLEHVVSWSAQQISSQLAKLVTAKTEGDLSALTNVYQSSAVRQEALHRIMQAVLRASWAVPSLGSPILFERRGTLRALTAYYVAPLDLVVTHRDALHARLLDEYEKRGKEDVCFEDFMEFHFANGFVDLRPIAVIVTARSTHENLNGKIQIFRDEASYLEGLTQLDPYSYFTTGGLLASIVRLKALRRFAAEMSFSLGTANEFRTHFSVENGRTPLVPGLVEAFRMLSEGLEKNTGAEFLDATWAYGRGESLAVGA
jgi:hypothetical protein